MASILNVDQIRNAAGTSAMTIDSSGNVNIPGHVMQVVQQHLTNTQETTNSTSFQNTSLAATITPSSSSSKILITVSTQSYTSSGGDIGLYGLNRSISGGSAGDLGTGQIFQANQQTGGWQSLAFTFLDSPSTTSATTYTLRFKSYAGSNYVYHGWGSGSGGSSQIMTLMEVGG